MKKSRLVLFHLLFLANIASGQGKVEQDRRDNGTPLPATQIKVGDATLDITFAPGEFDLPQSTLVDWITARAAIVAGYYDRFPVKRLRLLIIPKGGSNVGHGVTFGDTGAAIKLDLGRGVSQQKLDDDWVLVHEMVHLAFPSQPPRHHWIEEGIATYVEPIARAQAGKMSVENVWRGLLEGIPKGLPRAGDRGLDITHTWGRTYWGGALFCLLADVEIRRRTANKYGLQRALRAINNAGGTIEMEWPLEKVLDIGDRAVKTSVLSQLYDQMKATPVDTDLPDLWRRLGVAMEEDKVVFDDSAPLAAIRKAITANP